MLQERRLRIVCRSNGPGDAPPPARASSADEQCKDAWYAETPSYANDDLTERSACLKRANAKRVSCCAERGGSASCALPTDSGPLFCLREGANSDGLRLLRSRRTLLRAHGARRLRSVHLRVPVGLPELALRAPNARFRTLAHQAPVEAASCAWFVLLRTR